MVGLALLILVGEATIAFAALDLLFRYVPVKSHGLRQRLARWGRGYAAAGAVISLAGGWLQWRAVGAGGLVLAVLNGLSWWLLWRFGLRKQFTFLFSGGGEDAQRPGP